MKKGENIYKRKDGRWEGRFKKERNDTGNIVYGYVYGQCYSDVKEKLAVKKAQYFASLPMERSATGTVEEWLNYWLEQILRPTVKTSTYVNYRGKLMQHIFPYLGSIQLAQLTKTNVRAFVQFLDGKGLSNSTIQNIIHLLNGGLRQALKEELIVQNPCVDILLPSVRKYQPQALSDEDQKKLEKVALRDPQGAAIILALYTGMRIGEISGLRWTDIDRQKNVIYVRRTVSRISSTTHSGKTEIYIDLPKTQASLRQIPLPPNLKKYLLAKMKKETGPFIVSCKGGLTEPRIISYRFKKLLKQAGLPSIRFHSLRHTFATRCLEQNVDIATLSKILGHASIKMTLDTYADSLWDSRKTALNKLDKQLLLKK